MSPKNSKRSNAAQQLIENLLDELPSKESSRGSRESQSDEGSDPNAIAFDGSGSFGPVDPETSGNIPVIDLEAAEAAENAQFAEAKIPSKAKKPAPFEGSSPVVTKLAQRSRIVRPPADQIHKEERKRVEPDIDFGALAAEDPYEGRLSSQTNQNGGENGDENTVRVPRAGTLVSDPEPRSEVIQFTRADRGHSSPIDRGGATEIRSGIKIPPSPKMHSSGGGFSHGSAEASLKQSESLRIAQNRITELERELERVRRDNESLSTAGDTLRRRADELASRAEALEIHAREAAIRLEEEKKVLRGQVQQKERDNAEMKARVEEIETRLESNFKKIRVRERELEHRLEIVKMESATLISTKDKMLLDLKRQIDQLHQESDSAKSKSQELFGQYKEKQDTIRRVVRALRIALTILEGDDETLAPLKKAE